MVEVALSVTLPDFVEIVHIKLSNEGGVIAMLKVAGQNLSSKAVLV